MNENYDEPLETSEGDQAIEGTIICQDLFLLMHQIKEKASWKDGKRNSVTVFKAKELSIILIALHQESELARHVADGIISVQVLEGLLQFTTDQKSVELRKGQILVLQEEVFHSVKAIQQTIFLLTVSNSFVTKRNHL